MGRTIATTAATLPPKADMISVEIDVCKCHKRTSGKPYSIINTQVCRLKDADVCFTPQTGT